MRRIKTAKGDAYKKITVKVFTPGNRSFRTIRTAAKNGKAFTADGIHAFLSHIAEQVEKNYPLEDFRVVELGPADFNFVHERTRPAEQNASA